MTRHTETSRTETVLLVDDDESVRSVTRDMLLEGGYEVIEAANGQEALRLSRMHSGTIDLLLTDVIMPDMDGPTLAASFGHLRVGAPILFISGYAADALNFAAPASGTIRMLSKPFSVDELTRHVRAALASGQTAKKEAQDQDPARLSRNA